MGFFTSRMFWPASGLETHQSSESADRLTVLGELVEIIEGLPGGAADQGGDDERAHVDAAGMRGRRWRGRWLADLVLQRNP